MGAYVSRKQYYGIRNALSGKEKELINFYELQWHLRHTVPTIEEVAKQINQSQVSVNYYLQRRQVVKALEDRGIPFRQHTQTDLTATQVAAAVTMSNFADERSNADKLDQLGINPTTYYAWLNDPQFKNLVESLADQNLANIRPTAIGELTKKINAGDWNAVRYYLDVTGAAKSTEAPQTEQLLQAFVEVIQRHVKDPQLILAIAQDLKLATANRTLEAVITPPQITGSIVEDEELEVAKKQLGIG
jgi:hypothetical protein